MRGAAFDVLIVGGGVIGCALARELAGRGCRVTLVERGRPGEEASGAAAGLLSPQADSSQPGAFFDLCLRSRNLYPRWVRELEEETGIATGYRQTGILKCAFAPIAGSSRKSLLDSFLWQRERGLPVEDRWPAEFERRVARHLSAEVREALFFPDEAIVQPRPLMRALTRSLERRGVRLLANTAALRFRIENGVCRGVETDTGPLEAENVVDAAGAWAGFDSSLAVRVPVHPVRGQMVELRMKEESLPTVVESDEVYLVPRTEGRLLLGATVELVGYEKGVTAGAVRDLIAAAVRLVPSLSAAPFETAWAGLRPGSPDSLPILGGCDVPGLYLATGHFRNGILLAPVTALLLADLLAGGSSRGLESFSLGRFANGAPSRSERQTLSAGVFS